MVRYCSVFDCKENNNAKRYRRFFRFPNDETRCRTWLKAIGRLDLESKGIKVLHGSYFVCELHFPPSYCKKKYLRGDAFPTLLLPQVDSSGTSKYTQTDSELKCSSCIKSAQIPSTSRCSQYTQTLKQLSYENTCNKRKLQLEQESGSKLRRLLKPLTESFTNANESDMPPLLKKIIEAQKAIKRNSQGNRYIQEYFLFALNIYLASPVAYRFISEALNIKLPSMKTLERRTAFDISTKFDKNVIRCLESKSRKLSKSERYCIICADEVSLKRHLYYQINEDKVVGFHDINEQQTKKIATQAFVVMARGIFSNWKQPLAFCFLSQSNSVELNTWLDTIIVKMMEIGFNVCAVTSGQGSNFLKLTKIKSITTDQPFFFINGKKIYYIFDVPHLIKSLRNNLIKYDFVYHDDDGIEQIASWGDIEKMYEIEKTKKYKIAFKLTESHMKPNNDEKLLVKYATQVLSRSVAVAICTLVESGKLHEKSLGTTKFIEVINDTFDILNSSTDNDDYKYKRAFYQTDYQTNTLDKVQRILSELLVMNRQDGEDVTNTITCIKGFLISIKAISNLASDLNTMGYEFLYTRRLNQDPLENFIDKVKRQGGKCCKPSAIQFLIAFKKCFKTNIIRHTEYTNRSGHLSHLLLSVEKTQTTLGPERGLKVGTNDYRFDLPEENAFTYTCGYLLKKCHDYHKNCEIFEKYVLSCLVLLLSDEKVDKNDLLTYKAYRTDHPFDAFINPPECFKRYIKQIDIIFVNHFLNSDFYHIGNEILTKISETVFDLPCPCFPLEFLNKLFVRLRIFNVMQHNNKNFKDKTYEIKCFSISHSYAFEKNSCAPKILEEIKTD